MRGSAAFRTGVAPGGALAPGWVKNELWRRARAVPSLDLRFAENKSLVDATTGASLVTFTRASSGTFVGSDGVLRTAVTNLSLRSEKLDEAGQWSVIGSGATLTATTDVAAPNGAMTAWTLTSSGAAAQIQQAPTGISGATYTGSFYIRRRSGTGTVNIRVSENINTPLVGVTSEWQRFSFTATSTSTTIRLGVNLSGIADAVDLWGAQLEQSTTVGEYIPTTSVINSAPRFDHNPTTGESLGLLVEEARTNLQVRSEEFDNTGTWSRTGLSTVTANSSIAPDSLTTADTLVEDASTGSHRVFATTSSLAASTSYSLSVYVKASTRTIVRVEVRDSVGAFAAQDFNLTTQAIISAGSGTGAISALGNGWFRCTVTGTTSVLGRVGVVLIYSMQVAGNATYTGTNGTSAILLWGAQLEAGAFPTSYIPTTTAAATRSADVASISGSNFSSWYNQTEGTLFAQTQVAGYSSTTNPDLVGLFGANSVNDRIVMFLAGAGPNYRASISTSGVAQFLQNVVSLANIYDANNFAIAYKENDSVSFGRNANTTDTLVTLPVITSLNFNASGSATKYIKRLTYWPTRLANTTLQSITQ